MLGHEPLAAPLQGDQVVRAVEVSERQVGRESLLGRYQAVLRLRLHTATLQQQLHRYPLERVVEPAPPGYRQCVTPSASSSSAATGPGRRSVNVGDGSEP